MAFNGKEGKRAGMKKYPNNMSVDKGWKWTKSSEK